MNLLPSFEIHFVLSKLGHSDSGGCYFFQGKAAEESRQTVTEKEKSQQELGRAWGQHLMPQSITWTGVSDFLSFFLLLLRLELAAPSNNQVTDNTRPCMVCASCNNGAHSQAELEEEEESC